MSQKRRLSLAECTANGGARPSEVKLAGGARELEGVGKLHRQGQQPEGGHSLGQTTYRRSGHTDNLPRFYLVHVLVGPGFRMVELGYHILMANTFCCSAG